VSLVFSVVNRSRPSKFKFRTFWRRFANGAAGVFLPRSARRKLEIEATVAREEALAPPGKWHRHWPGGEDAKLPLGDPNATTVGNRNLLGPTGIFHQIRLDFDRTPSPVAQRGLLVVEKK
jgi:hypothetical protein